MYALKLARRARDDLDEIARYLMRETASPALARDFVDLLLSRCWKLAETPFQLGRARHELGVGLRSLVEGNYVILFRYEGNRVEVVRIVEGHRSIADLFDETPGDDP